MFLLGGHLGFVYGDELVDAHRFGISVAYDSIARSTDRTMALITPMVTYETGFPFQLEVGLGWSIPKGTTDFADNYGGVTSQATLRWAFQNRAKPSKVSVGLGLIGRVTATTSNFDYSSAFIGAQIDLGYHFGHKQGDK